MSTLTRRNHPVTDLLGWIDREPFGIRVDSSPLVRVEDYVDDEEYVLRAEVPGVDPDHDIEVSVTGDVLTIRGERRREEKQRGHHEFHYGTFVRSVHLPTGAKTDDMTATYDAGVLEVRVPIEAQGSATRTVPVRRSDT